MQNYLYTPSRSRYAASPYNKENDTTFTAPSLYKNSTAYKSTHYGSKSQNRSMVVSRLEEARNTIDEVIVDLNEKKAMNHEAIQEVKSVNSELMEGLNQNYAFETRSQYVPAPAQTVPSFKYETSTAYDYRSPEAADGAAALKSELREERLRNSELMMRVSRMEEENKQLKHSQMTGYGMGDDPAQLRAENAELRSRLSQFRNLSADVYGELE